MKSVIVVGYGDRGQAYTKFSVNNPDKIRVVGVVEPNEFKRALAKERFNLSDENCFSDVESCIKRGKIADSIINSTMDKMHIKTALPFIELKYDMLLEKPITNNKEELLMLKEAAQKSGSRLMICHVLRYTPFYVQIKQTLASGEIGDIISMETAEYVGVAHYSASYARGKWRNSKECGSSMLLAKCCHDLDLLCWMNNAATPVKAASFGGRYFFLEKNAPKGAGTRCLNDCSVEKDCIYSCKKLMLDNNYFGQYAWTMLNKPIEQVSYEDKVQSLKTDNPQGECIFKTQGDIVDRQQLLLQFDNGSVASHGMIASVARPGRHIHIVGTLGEIEGFLEDNKFKVRLYNPANCLYTERKVVITGVEEGDGHSGGDSRIMSDYYCLMSGMPRSISSTVIDDSINGHLCVYAADESLEGDGKLVKIQ